MDEHGIEITKARGGARVERIGPAGWKRISAVAWVFSLIVLVLLLLNHRSKEGEDPLDSDAFRELKVALSKDPENEKLKERIREMDLELRSEFFRRQRFGRTGAYLLLGGLLVALGSLKESRRQVPKLPEVPDGLEIPDDGGRGARLGRRALIVTASVLGAIGVFVVTLHHMRDAQVGAKPSGSETEVVSNPAIRFPSAEEIARNWPRFRGPGGLGISPFGDPPTSWNGKTGDGILWKSEIPLPGASSPLVWAGRIFLTGASAETEEVYCYDAESGNLLWRKSVVVPGKRPEPPEVLMEEEGFAAGTGVVDGQRVYVTYANGFLACFDFAGKQLWSRNFGPFENSYGHASSLAMHDRILLVQIDQAYEDDGLSKLAGLDALSGKTVWETPRKVDSSWATPVVVPLESGPQVVACAAPWVVSYQPASGEEIWRADCLAGEVTPSPVYAGNVVYTVHLDAALSAIRTDGKGDVTDTHVVWEAEDNLPDVTSPLADGECVFLLTTGGVLTCYRAADGELVWEHELEGSFYASPVRAGERLFLTTQKGLTYVGAAGPETFEEIGKSEIGEGIVASLAFAPGRIYIRTKEHLYAIGRP